MTAVLDPSVYLELAFDQPRKSACRRVLEVVNEADLDAAIVDYHRDGICYLLGEVKGRDAIRRFLTAMTFSRGLSQYPLSTFELYEATDVMESASLDFDDACGVVAARNLGGDVVSLDDDYDGIDGVSRVAPEDFV